MHHLFVYGTLLFDELVEELTLKSFKTGKAVINGYKRVKVKHADYPAITPEENAQVEGKLIFDLDEKSIGILSFYEGDGYQRKKIEVQCENELELAWVFIWNGEETELESFDWDESEFKKSHLNEYIASIAPETRETYSYFCRTNSDFL